MGQSRNEGARSADFGPFLHAQAGTQANSVPVSVLSLFARRGEDPWAEAERLAGLPASVATGELARVLAGGGCALSSTPQDTAASLLRLLPDGRQNGDAARERAAERRMLKALLLLCVLWAFAVAGAGILFQGWVEIGGGATPAANGRPTVSHSRERPKADPVREATPP